MAWLIPNHYYPWATFHSDAWVAVMMAVVALSVILCNTGPVQWHGISILLALLAGVPFIQFAVGMLPFSGQAWLGMAYILGLLLAVLIGARWEAATPGRAIDGLFLAITIASLVSVALQLRQWLELAQDLADMQVWAAEFTPGRPSANLGQPNQLATLLLWALLGCIWGVIRKKIRPGFAVLAAMPILFGIVLAQSRIASLALLAMVLAAWAWRRMLHPRAPWVITLLVVYFWVCTFSLQYLSELCGLDVQIRSASLGGASTQLRLKAYSLFFDAVAQQPWWGYGWSRLAVAQLAVAQNHVTLTSFFLHSHNLFLDLILWCGIPIGGLVSVFLLFWLFRAISMVANVEDAVLVLFLVVVGMHAMVELPLHHAYLLLPTGLVIGILNQRQYNRVVWISSRWLLLGLWGGASILLGGIVRDYLRVDESFRDFRLEAAHVGSLHIGGPPDVLILNDMRELIHYAREGVDPHISEIELQRLYGVVTSFPSPSNMFNYAKALAFRRGPIQAEEWIVKMQKVEPAEFDRDLHLSWDTQAKTQPAMAAVHWPQMDQVHKGE